MVHDTDCHIQIFSHFSVYVVHDIDSHILIFSHFSVYVVHWHCMWHIHCQCYVGQYFTALQLVL